ncbi:MAG: D-Ala-D-Ala carboxypeptidase family metallohydrolase [Cyclobacteriaceae bacterium]
MKAWKWIVSISVVGIILAALFNRKRVMDDLKKIRLGKNFTLDEFVVTSTGIDNIPPQKSIDALTNLVQEGLQKLRDYYGWPISPNSGYRSPLVNAAVPGSSDTSQHPKGEAVDFSVKFRYTKKNYTEAQSLQLVLTKISAIGKTKSNIEAIHDGDEWIWKLTNQTIVDDIRRIRLPYDQLIDEQRGASLWVHWSIKHGGTQRLQWMTRRDPGPDRPKEYETIKYGYA